MRIVCYKPDGSKAEASMLHELLKQQAEADEQKEAAEEHGGYYDEHYAGKVQPIELMQAQMSPKAFRGFLLGNIIKYASRIGKKDDALEEAVKIRRYADWLVQNEKGETINPRD